MTSMADLRLPAFPAHWHEAVAVIAELVDTMRASGLVRVPAPASVVMTEDGTLLVSGRGTLDGSPPRALAGLLEEMLSSVSYPPELGQVVAQNLAEPPAHATLEDFAEALAFFERPGRRELVKAIAERATHVQSEARAEDELKRLAARARDKPDQSGDARPQGRPSRSRRKMLLVASTTAALVMAGAVFVLRASGSKLPTISGRVQARVTQIVRSGLEAIGVAKADVSPAPADSPAAVPAPRTNRERVPRTTPPPALTIHVTDAGRAPVLDPQTPEEPALPDLLVDTTVYNADAEGVDPPVLVRPHLPSLPADVAEAEQLGVLELVVSDTGAVEQVRLISPQNRYHDRMIVAAAKAWRFRPAMKNGSPVRSRTRIRVTL